MTDTQYQSHHNGRYIHTVPDAGLVISRERRKEGRERKGQQNSVYLSIIYFAIFCTKNEEQNPDGKESEENFGTAYTYRILIAPHGAGNLTGVSKGNGMEWDDSTN